MTRERKVIKRRLPAGKPGSGRLGLKIHSMHAVNLLPLTPAGFGPVAIGIVFLACASTAS